VWPYLARPLREFHGDLNELAIALVDRPTLMDVCTLSRCAVEDHMNIRDVAELHIGPTFAQSGPLGGADADLIYDDTLLDLKSTSTARVLGRIELWQLLGYLFADADNAYRIRQVGFGALRRRRSIFWPSQELIDLLAGRPSSPVEHWRREFAGLLASCASDRVVVVRGARCSPRSPSRACASASFLT
jgi:hypothetical protein